MGSIADWFTFKTAKQRAKEEKQFARWAFPYGAEQRDKIEQIIRGLLPKEDPKVAMAVFLLGKQAYMGSYDDDPEDLQERTEERRQAALDRQLSEQLFGRYKKFTPYYKVLVMADSKVDETLNYPSVEELRSQAEELMKK